MLPGLDTLRGIAIAGVFLFHVALLCLVDLGVRNTGIVVALGLGGFGVDLFFVLSGYLITQRLLDYQDKPQYFSAFFVRRTFRILPAYFAFLAFFTLAWPFIAEAASLDAALTYGPGKYVISFRPIQKS